MGNFDTVLNGVQQAVAQPPPQGQMPSVTTDESTVMASMIQKRAAEQDARQTLTDNSVTRILAAGGQGLSDVGQNIITQKPLIPEEEIEKAVPITGEDNWLQSMGKNVVRNAIRTGGFAADGVNTIMNAFTAPALGMAQGILQQTGKETGIPAFSAAAEEFNDPAMMAILHQVHGMPVQDVVAKPPLPHEMYRAIDNGILEPSDPALKAEAAQVMNDRAARLEAQKGLVDTTQGLGIQDIARNLQPDLFEEKDRLESRQQALKDNLNEPEEAFGKEYDQKLDDLKAQAAEHLRAPTNLEGDELAKAVEEGGKKYEEVAAQIKALGSRDDYIKDAAENARQEFQKNDYRLRDIAPQAFAAWREAATQHGNIETVEPETHEVPKEETKPEEESLETPVTHPTANIEQDIEQKLTETGRSPEEAQASSKIIGSFFNTLAKIYPEKGTAQEIYDREKTNILSGKTGKIGKKELAQGVLGSFRAATDRASAIIKLAKTADASTFLHESAHHFFDIIHRYAQEEGAPQRLKDDYATARKWMGIEEGADLYERNSKGKYTYTRKLEKFSRGFEQYMREGIAPSKELAGVFSKFKTWITDVYNTLKKAGQPISDDIRGVFDRMLAETPEKTIIAPEEPAKALAAIHETDAKTTPPEQKDAVADQVAKEIDTTAKIHDPEVADAIKAAETGSITETPASGAANAGTRQRAGERGIAQESGNVTEFRSEPSTGSAGTRTTDERPEPASKSVKDFFDKAGNIRLENLTNDDDVKAALRLMAQKYPEVLNHDVVSDVAVAEMARELGVKNPDKAIAKLRGMAAEDGIPLASYVRAVREMLAKAHDEAIDFAAKVEDGTREDFLNAMEAKNRFMMLAATVSETANELGRALRAFQDISGVKASAEALSDLFQMSDTSEEKMRDLFKLIASKKAPSLRGQAAKVMQASVKPGFWDMGAEYFRCSVLSGWVTHSLWLAGTATNIAYKGLVLDTLQGIHNEIGMMIGREDTGSRVTGGIEGLYRTITKALPSILSATGTAAHTGKTVLRPFEGQSDTFLATGGIKKTLNINMDALKKAVDEGFNESDYPELKALRDKLNATNNEFTKNALQRELEQRTEVRKAQVTNAIAARMQSRLKTWGDLKQEMSDFGSSVLAGIESTGKKLISPDFYKDKPLLEAKRGEGALPDIYVKGIPVVPIGSVMRGISGRIYSTMHTFCRETAANIEVAQEARRMAVEEGAKDIEARRNEMLSDPSRELMQRVTKISNKQTLMSNESQFAKAITRFRDEIDRRTGTRMGSIIFPVIGVPAEATAQTVVEHSVFGLAIKSQREALTGNLPFKESNYPELKEIRRKLNAATNKGDMAKAAFLQKTMDEETTKRVGDLKKQSALAQERAQVKLFAGTALTGLGFWLASENMATPSPPLNYKKDQERKDAGQQSGSVRISDWMVSLAHLPITGTVLTMGADLHHVMNVLQGDESDKLKPAVEAAINNFLLHENALVNISNLIDAIRGESDITSYLKGEADSLIPQFIKQTNDVVDPVVRDSRAFLASLQSRIPGESENLDPRINALTGEPLGKEPWHTYTANPDPVAANLTQLNMYPTSPQSKINGVDLDPHQFAEYSSIKGHILHNGLQMLMEGDGKEDYAAADTNDKRKMVQRIERHAANCSKSVMFNKYPELLKDANDKYEASCRDELQ